jgi:hypothetical protein
VKRRKIRRKLILVKYSKNFYIAWVIDSNKKKPIFEEKNSVSNAARSAAYACLEKKNPASKKKPGWKEQKGWFT